MKRFPLFLLFTLLTLSTVPAQADIIDDTIGNIQQAINDAYNPDGSAFSISHASNWWLIWVRITRGERIT